MARLTEIEYSLDSARRFEGLLDLPGAVFLDSGLGGALAGRYDILAADPFAQIVTTGDTSEIRAGSGVELSADDPLTVLEQLLGAPSMPVASLPFSGGAIGYFGYDLGRRYERIGGSAAADIDMPDLVVGIYDWAIVVDHLEGRCWLVGQGRDPATFDRWRDLVDLAGSAPPARPRRPFEVVSDIRSNLSRAQYAQAFAAIQGHIYRGDCYQINLTQRFDASVRGDSWDAYQSLRLINPAPFSAFLQCDEGDILCSSPERFLSVSSGAVETRPIKGTRRRSPDPKEDRRLAAELRASAKDRAENVMIVDLLRNDLGRCCVPGSVRADRLFEVESFASVHQLVSTVVGQLRPDAHALDLLRACFPGGSITGAPKVSAMQIIDEVEPQRRGIYCGSIGYVGFDGNMDTNIAIRTLLRRRNTMYAWSGGGIVADSDVDAEYQESLDKAAALLAILKREAPAAVG